MFYLVNLSLSSFFKDCLILIFEYILKEQLFKYISRMDCVKDLPVDVLSKIDSEKNWRPEIFESKV